MGGVLGNPGLIRLVLLCASLSAAAALAQVDGGAAGASPSDTGSGRVEGEATLADGGIAGEAPATDGGVATDVPRPPRRPVPDYEGRGPEPTTTGEVLVWVPRIILLPAYLVANYVIAAPVGALATTAERNQWPTWILNFFAFGPDHQGGIFPTFFVDFGMRPSIGLHFFWNNTFVLGNRVTADAAWGGHDWIAIAVGDHYQITQHEAVSLQAFWNRRPDTLYFGIGPESLDSNRSRIGSDVVGGTLGYDRILGRLTVNSSLGLKRTVFRDYTCCSDPSLQNRVEAGQLPPPPGYQENTTAAQLSVKAVLDTRPPRPLPQTGFRIGATVAPSVDVTRGFDRSSILYGAGMEGSIDLTGTARVLSLGVTALFVDPLGSQPVPFTELTSLGGTEPFAGFLPSRFRDRSAIVAQLGWHWPIVAFLDGLAAVSFGNVFDAHLSTFRWDLLRMSAEIGLRSAGTGTSSFEFIFGLGTHTFHDGFGVESFRLAFGVSYGL